MKGKWRIHFICISIGLIFIVVGVLNPGEVRWSDILWEIVKHLGIALIVAGLISLTVESYLGSRREEEHQILRNEISLDVFHAVLKQSFPPSIYDQVKAHLLTESFLRKDFKIEVSMAEHKGSGHLRAIVTHEYQVKRLVDRACSYKLESYLDLEPLQGVEVSARFLSLNVEGPDGNTLKSYNENNICNIIDAGEPMWTRIHEDIDMSQHEIAKVIIKAEVYYRKNDYHVWMMTGITENLSVTYYAPENLVFLFGANHPSSEQFKESNDGMTHSCEFKGGILPFQGITVSWRPKVN